MFGLSITFAFFRYYSKLRAGGLWFDSTKKTMPVTSDLDKEVGEADRSFVVSEENFLFWLAILCITPLSNLKLACFELNSRDNFYKNNRIVRKNLCKIPKFVIIEYRWKIVGSVFLPAKVVSILAVRHAMSVFTFLSIVRNRTAYTSRVWEHSKNWDGMLKR